MLSGKVSKIFRRNSNRRRKDPPRPPLSEETTLSPIIERSSIITSSEIRPVPPPLGHQYSHHGSQYEEYPEDIGIHEPQSRLYETFSASEAGSRHPVAHSVRDDDGLHHHHRHGSEFGGEAHTDIYASEMGYGGPHSERGAHEPTILISPSERSHSSQGSQRVAFRDMGTHSHGTAPSVPKRSMSVTSRGDRSRAIPVMASTQRSDYTYPRRRQSPRRYASGPVAQPRAARHGDVIRQQLPYMIFVDDGHGLEIGNEADGFMPYEQYLATAHLRETPTSDTYYIIPGSTVVEFHDESGHVLWRVDGRKYLTPTLRRRKYIIQDSYGRELFRIGNFNHRSSGGSSSHSSGGSKAPKVMYLNPESSHPSLNKYKSMSRASSSQSGSGSGSNRVHHHYQQAYQQPHQNQMHHYEPAPFSRGTLFEDRGSLTSSNSSAPNIVVVNENGEPIYDSRDIDQRSQRSILLSSPRSKFANELRDRDMSSAESPSISRSPSNNGDNRGIYVDPEGHPVIVKSDHTASTSTSRGSSSSSGDSLYALPRRQRSRRR